MPQRNFHGNRRRRHGGGSGAGGGRPQYRRNNSSRQRKKDVIHPSKFVRVATPQEEEAYVPQHSFADFAIDATIKQNLARMNFTQPSPIQDKTIPLSLEGKDIIGIANTGTGKTAAFAIPVVNRLIREGKSKAIVVAPTRELAQQVKEQFRMIARGSGIEMTLLIGGTSMGRQLKELRYNPRVIIGTPGRIKDHLERRTLDISDCNMVVLDEVDRMLDMGFINDMRTILSHTNDQRQSSFFSATLDDRVRKLINDFSHNPVRVSVKSTNTSQNVHQDVVKYQTVESKVDVLHEILTKEGVSKTIIFDDTQRSVEKLSKRLEERGFDAASIHGGKNQSQRRRVLNKFKENHVTVLVATDVAARGLDISDISHVINFSQPQTYDDYVHRIGRTGRAGKVGQAYTFVQG